MKSIEIKIIFYLEIWRRYPALHGIHQSQRGLCGAAERTGVDSSANRNLDEGPGYYQPDPAGSLQDWAHTLLVVC